MLLEWGWSGWHPLTYISRDWRDQCSGDSQNSSHNSISSIFTQNMLTLQELLIHAVGNVIGIVIEVRMISSDLHIQDWRVQCTLGNQGFLRLLRAFLVLFRDLSSSTTSIIINIPLTPIISHSAVACPGHNTASGDDSSSNWSYLLASHWSRARRLRRLIGQKFRGHFYKKKRNSLSFVNKFYKFYFLRNY